MSGSCPVLPAMSAPRRAARNRPSCRWNPALARRRQQVAAAAHRPPTPARCSWRQALGPAFDVAAVPGRESRGRQRDRDRHRQLLLWQSPAHCAPTAARQQPGHCSHHSAYSRVAFGLALVPARAAHGNLFLGPLADSFRFSRSRRCVGTHRPPRAPIRARGARAAPRGARPPAASASRERVRVYRVYSTSTAAAAS
eukprot:COSAG03_NODE_3889_length_1777_cov_13.818236_1_plen_197_part_00